MEMVRLDKSKIVDVLGFLIVILLLSYYTGNIIKLITLKEIQAKNQKKRRH